MVIMYNSSVEGGRLEAGERGASVERSEWVARFRERLSELIAREGVSRAAFAARIGLDRSTLSQLLSSENARLPRAETIAAIARSCQVSADWLLGLSQSGRPGTELVAGTLEIEPGGASPMDERLRRWRSEAIGSKIRYVPTTLPDVLKTATVCAYEFRGHSEADTATRRRDAESNLNYTRIPETDMEACCPAQVFKDLAHGHGMWRELPKADRLEQLAQAARLAEELYPTFRMFLYDGRDRFSVPFTILGSKRVAVYFGEMYFVFNATEHIRIMTRHFDALIRAATVQPTEIGSYLTALCREAEDVPA